MTCTGCGREVTLLDGHYCGHCLAEIADAVGDALERVDALDGEIYDVVTMKDGYLHVRIDDEKDVATDGGQPGIGVEDLDECWCCGGLHDIAFELTTKPTRHEGTVARRLEKANADDVGGEDDGE